LFFPERFVLCQSIRQRSPASHFAVHGAQDKILEAKKSHSAPIMTKDDIQLLYEYDRWANKSNSVTPNVLRDLLGMAHKFVTANAARRSTSRHRRKPF
jgi:hypothetical protein